MTDDNDDDDVLYTEVDYITTFRQITVLNLLNIKIG